MPESSGIAMVPTTLLFIRSTNFIQHTKFFVIFFHSLSFKHHDNFNHRYFGCQQTKQYQSTY